MMQKTIVNIIVLLILFARICLPQAEYDASSIDPGWGTLNYAVPESPAFKILGVSSDNIMRPTSTRDIGISIGNYYINNGATIPKNITVEISPSLFNPDVSLADYQSNGTRLWYTSALSVGTKVNQDGSYQIGAGIKVKLVDKTDLRSNGKLINFINNIGPVLTNDFEKAMDTVVENYKKDKKVDRHVAYDSVFAEYNDSGNPKHAEIEKKVNDSMLSSGSHLAQKIIDYREEIKESLWNADIWDLGIAALFASKDSLLKSIKAPSIIGLWTTYGLPITSKGQLLIGLNTQVKDDSTGQLNTFNGNIGLKAYYGKNNTKGFIQGESGFAKSELPVFKMGIGIETTFAESIWIDCSLGMTKTGGHQALFTPGINISYAPGGKTK